MRQKSKKKTTKPVGSLLLTLSKSLPEKSRAILLQEISDFRFEYEEAISKNHFQAKLIVVYYYAGIAWSAFWWFHPELRIIDTTGIVINMYLNRSFQQMKGVLSAGIIMLLLIQIPQHNVEELLINTSGGLELELLDKKDTVEIDISAPIDIKPLNKAVQNDYEQDARKKSNNEIRKVNNIAILLNHERDRAPTRCGQDAAIDYMNEKKAEISDKVVPIVVGKQEGPGSTPLPLKEEVSDAYKKFRAENPGCIL